MICQAEARFRRIFRFVCLDRFFVSFYIHISFIVFLLNQYEPSAGVLLALKLHGRCQSRSVSVRRSSLCSLKDVPIKLSSFILQMFRGDAECLVDMLIQASQARPQPVPQLEGRELVKWSDDSCIVGSALLDMPLECNRCVPCVADSRSW